MIRLKTEKGFTLSEVIVVVALMAILTSFSAVLIANLQSMLVTTSRQLRADEVHAELTMILANPKACFNTFGGLNYAGGANVAVPQIINSFGTPRYSSGGPYNQTITIVSMKATNFLVTNLLAGTITDAPSPYNGRFDLAVVYRYALDTGQTRDVTRVSTIKTESRTTPIWTNGKLAYDPDAPFTPPALPQVGCTSNAGIAFGYDPVAGAYMSRSVDDIKYGNLTINNGNLEVAGTTTIESDFFSLSDRRYKYNLQKPKINFEKIKKVIGYSFNWKSTKRKDSGFIAQEVEKEFPEAVYSGKGSAHYKAMNYSSLVPILAHSSKDLIKRNKKIELDLFNLDKKIKELEFKKKEK